jgi:S-adenosylmethionine:tRNA ribosyltransferase-isomerase
VPDRYRTADFEYEYPPEAVAQRPLPDRRASRLLKLSRSTGRIEHTTFDAFPSLPNSGDVLVLNVTRVIRARLTGRRENGRNAEILLTRPAQDGTWLAMVHPGGKLKVGRTVTFGADVVAEIVEVLRGGLRRIRLTGSLSMESLMDKYGDVPLPPYIQRAPDETDLVRYQTVYAREDGSVAAPTAGLHFTPQILDQLRMREVGFAEIVLHVGPGTFKPVQVDDPSEHVMHEEWFSVSEAAASMIARARNRGHRIWAVGTTCARVLETLAARGGVQAAAGWTDLFICPPYQFKLVDALLTNFHLPRSTLLMLVSAFAGHERTMHAYREAVAQGYRLYSYGDAMVIV